MSSWKWAANGPFWLNSIIICLSWSRTLQEKVIITQLVEKYSSFYGTLRFVTFFTRTRHWPVT
jgi:hypothetical protein